MCTRIITWWSNKKGGTNLKPAQRLGKEAFLLWAAKLTGQGTEVYAVYKRAGLVLGCNASSLLLGSSVRWFARKSWMSATNE
jgi:hypothetical protein